MQKRMPPVESLEAKIDVRIERASREAVARVARAAAARLALEVDPRVAAALVARMQLSSSRRTTKLQGHLSWRQPKQRQMR